MWSCPHHKSCSDCGKSKGAVGFLFRCMMCPNAHCEDCLQPDHEILLKHKVWEDLGFTMPNSTCFILCSAACIEFSELQKQRQLENPITVM